MPRKTIVKRKPRKLSAYNLFIQSFKGKIDPSTGKSYSFAKRAKLWREHKGNIEEDIEPSYYEDTPDYGYLEGPEEPEEDIEPSYYEDTSNYGYPEDTGEYDEPVDTFEEEKQAIKNEMDIYKKQVLAERAKLANCVNEKSKLKQRDEAILEIIEAYQEEGRKITRPVIEEITDIVDKGLGIESQTVDYDLSSLAEPQEEYKPFLKPHRKICKSLKKYGPGSVSFLYSEKHPKSMKRLEAEAKRRLASRNIDDTPENLGQEEEDIITEQLSGPCDEYLAKRKMKNLPSEEEEYLDPEGIVGRGLTDDSSEEDSDDDLVRKGKGGSIPIQKLLELKEMAKSGWDALKGVRGNRDKAAALLESLKQGYKVLKS